MTGGAETSPKNREVYSLAGSEAISRYCTARSMHRQGAFFMPYLKSGMRALDCGSGPGTITLGLAQAVTPGEVIGMDISETDVKRAQSLAVEKGVSNVRFQVGDAYAIPFPDNTFDAVFCHNVLEHLDDPVGALREMRRVLKPGGVVGVRDMDFGGRLHSPDDPSVTRWVELFVTHWNAVGGGSPFMGRHLKGLMLQAGLANVEGSASYDLWESPDLIQAGIAIMAGRLSEPSFVDWVTRQGLETREGLGKLATAIREWWSRPDAFTASAHCESVGWKE